LECSRVAFQTSSADVGDGDIRWSTYILTIIAAANFLT
jgi:hypothetical protein